MCAAARPLTLSVLFAVGAALTAVPAANAQIVNTQPLLSKVGSKGFTGELGASADWRTGNVDLLRLSGSLLMLYKTSDHTVIWSSRGDYGTKGGEEFIAQVFSHLRYQYEASELVTWEIFTQVSTTKFKRLGLRALAGTGPRWNLLRRERGSLGLGTAYLFEHEELSHSTFADSGRVDNNHRLSAYLTGTVALNNMLTLVHTTYFQPRLDAFATDFRIFSTTNLAISLLKKLALKVGFDLSYDSEPPIDVKKLDTALTFGVSWGF